MESFPIDSDQEASTRAREEAPAGSPRIDYAFLRRQIDRSVNRVCPRWLSGQRDDIVQSAVLRILEAEKKCELTSPVPASYLWKVAYSATVDRIRRIRREREVPVDGLPPEEAGADPRARPFADQELRDLSAGIERCLERLSEPRRLVVGFHLLGHTLAEMERLSGWNGRKVRNLLYRGLTDLRRCLVAKGIRP